MSSIPGLRLEDFVMWNHDIVVEDQPDANASLLIAEMVGYVPPRSVLPAEQFAELVALYEPVRESVEQALVDFNEDSQSWRDYSVCIYIPDEIGKAAAAAAAAIVKG